MKRIKHLLLMAALWCPAVLALIFGIYLRMFHR